MTAAEARSKIKDRLDIASATTDFDTMIDGFVTDSVDRLFPITANEYYPTDYSLAASTNQVALSAIDADLKGIDKIWIKSSTQNDYQFEVLPSEEWSVKGGRLFFRTSWGEANTLKIAGTKRYTLATLPAELNLVIVYWGLSEFYESMIGNSRKYNLYMQTSGRSKLDNMQDESDRADSKGNALLMDRIEVGGV